MVLKPAGRGRGTKFLVFLAVSILITIVGFYLYNVLFGMGSITVLLYLIVVVMGVGSVFLFLVKQGEAKLDSENIFIFVIVIGLVISFFIWGGPALERIGLGSLLPLNAEIATKTIGSMIGVS